ncbi:MAG: HDOD domain-containing protein [Thermodesulfobacteriota bacterium]
MKEKDQPSEKLAEFLSKINMSELPAMSTNVHELVSLTSSARSASYELSRVILKDYSLTNKILQVVNSAYYAVGKKVSSISRAVTVLGFDAVRNLAAAIAIFEDFVKKGLDKEEISKLLTKAFLSAVQARDMVAGKNLSVVPEEAFICALLHNLGKTMVCIYAPDIFREVQRQVEGGKTEKQAAEEILGLGYNTLGEEIAKFWNLSDQIVGSMNPDPPPPFSSMDSEGMLRCVADYSNRLVDCVCDGMDLAPLMEKYGEMLKTDALAAVESLQRSIEASEDVSDALRYGLTKLRFRSRLQATQEAVRTNRPVKMITETTGDTPEPQAAAIDELPASKEKSVNDFIHDLTETLMGKFDLNEFYVQLLEALYQGVGFDRVVLMILDVRGRKPAIIGRYGLGDIDTRKVSSFRCELDRHGSVMAVALKLGKDMVVPGDKEGAFPDNLKPYLQDRLVYIFPLLVEQRPIGLVCLDRKKGRPPLDQAGVKSVRLFRDFAVMAIRKISGRS